MLIQFQVFLFKNIRYAAPPVGPLRWKKPQPPNKETEIQDARDRVARACTQPFMDNVKTTQNGFVGTGFEDCLYLDLTIPKKVWENPSTKVPVLVWIHGGYYST